MNVWLQLLHAALNLLKHPWKAMLVLLLLCSISLFSPYGRADVWLQSHRTMQWGCLLFASFYLVLTTLSWMAHNISLLWHLHHLADDERRTLSAFATWGVTTRSTIAHTATSSALTSSGILKECAVSNPNNVRVRRGESFFTIKPWILRYLRKRPALLHFD